MRAHVHVYMLCMWKKEESEWSEPVVLHAAGKKQMNNLGMAFEELVKNIGESR